MYIGGITSLAIYGHDDGARRDRTDSSEQSVQKTLLKSLILEISLN